MSTPAERLAQLESWLGHEMGDALSAALEVDVPAGTSPAWNTILESHGIAATEQESRVREATATGMLRGVPVDELYEVFGAITKEGEKRLESIAYPDDGPDERRWDRLRALLGRIREETIKAYRKRVFPKKSMFGAAMAAASASKKPADKRSTDAFVMRCDNCGAPRLNQTDFNCEYCDTPYAG